MEETCVTIHRVTVLLQFGVSKIQDDIWEKELKCRKRHLELHVFKEIIAHMLLEYCLCQRQQMIINYDQFIVLLPLQTVITSQKSQHKLNLNWMIQLTVIYKSWIRSRSSHKNMTSERRQPKRLCLAYLPVFFSVREGRMTTCIVMIPPGSSPTGSLDSASVLLFSSILPALINFMSWIVFGRFSLSTKERG